MNKGRIVIIALVVLALATAIGFIMGYQTGRPVPPGAAIVPRPAPAAGPAPSEASPLPATTDAPAPHAATGAMDDASARRAAIAILKGDPYGRTDAEVSANIVAQRLDRDGDKSQWVFQVKTSATPDYPDGIEGTLIIDAADGRLITAGLPFLD